MQCVVMDVHVDRSVCDEVANVLLLLLLLFA
jgi:hypothetical protein